jgi:ribosomal protein L3
LIRGAVPGSRGGDVVVMPAKRVKKVVAKPAAAPAANAKK